MALMIPSEFPHDVRRKPRLRGELAAFAALAKSLPDWLVFYDRAVVGTRRRVDFLGLCIARGVLAIEVKGGLVHDVGGGFGQLVTASGLRKRINPFGQVKMALARIGDAVGIDVSTAPVHHVVWFPMMAQSAFPWRASDHIWTRETCEDGAVDAVIARALPRPASNAGERILRTFVAALA